MVADSTVPEQTGQKYGANIVIVLGILLLVIVLTGFLSVKLRIYGGYLTIKEIVNLINNRKDGRKYVMYIRRIAYGNETLGSLGSYVLYKIKEKYEIQSWEEEEPNNITHIWLSEAPQAEVSDFLLRVFTTNKPTIYIGSVMQYTEKDREGLKRLLVAKFNIQVWEEVTKYRDLRGRFMLYLQFYLGQLEEEIKLPDNQQNNYINRENDFLHICCGEEGVTHLLTNKGKIYRSTRADPNSRDINSNHAERHFLRDIKKNRILGNDVHTLLIENSPCINCIEPIIEHYRNSENKPNIKVGKIYKLKESMQTTDQQYFEKMVKMCVEGFEISLWQDFTIQWYGPRLNPNAVKYIENIRKEAEKRKKH